MESKKIPRIQKKVGYKLDISIRMIMICFLNNNKTSSHQNYAFYSSSLFQRDMVVFIVQRAFVAPGITEPRQAWNTASPSMSL